ncbi:MAG: STAS domain-containing protein [Acidimicrobiaceae bacterium]|nr:STAS domain-containing protein [Acidimicrobiaceae bacterium]MYC43390.1 STAS domain-containing protein [Acidimicrobiaceae bacterium]MYH88661.1 STAS domain-containing protein [Acidimicrobiaceae bacterium]
MSSTNQSASVARRMSATRRSVHRGSDDRDVGEPQRQQLDKTGYDALVLEISASRVSEGNYVVLRPVGELDAYSVAQFRETFAQVSEEQRLLVDLSGVQFMDSAGLGALIGGIRKVRDNDGRISVFSDRAAISRLLHTTGFDRIVPVKEDVLEAVAALSET